MDLEEIIHGCSSEERSYDGLWQVYRSKHVPASLELGAACFPQTPLVLWTGESSSSSRSLAEEQANPGNVSEIWGLFWRLAKVVHVIWKLSFALSCQDLLNIILLFVAEGANKHFMPVGWFCTKILSNSHLQIQILISLFYTSIIILQFLLWFWLIFK